MKADNQKAIDQFIQDIRNAVAKYEKAVVRSEAPGISAEGMIERKGGWVTMKDFYLLADPEGEDLKVQVIPDWAVPAQYEAIQVKDLKGSATVLIPGKFNNEARKVFIVDTVTQAPKIAFNFFDHAEDWVILGKEDWVLVAC